MLVFNRGEYTQGRRSSPIPQTECHGYCPLEERYHPSTIVCSNAGWDGSDVVWKCEAQLNKEFRLGKVVVSCEGYDHPDDPYVLKGIVCL